MKDPLVCIYLFTKRFLQSEHYFFLGTAMDQERKK